MRPCAKISLFILLLSRPDFDVVTNDIEPAVTYHFEGESDSLSARVVTPLVWYER